MVNEIIDNVFALVQQPSATVTCRGPAATSDDAKVSLLRFFPRASDIFTHVLGQSRRLRCAVIYPNAATLQSPEWSLLCPNGQEPFLEAQVDAEND